MKILKLKVTGDIQRGVSMNESQPVAAQPVQNQSPLVFLSASPAPDPNHSSLDPPAAEYPPNSPKKHRWPKIRRKKMRLAENPPNRKFAAAAEKNCG